MKKLIINSTSFKLTLQGFKEWLVTQNYSESMQKNYPNHINGLLHYLETNTIGKLDLIEPSHLLGYTNHIKHRKNELTEAGLSSSTINQIINAINKFLEYLSKTKDINLTVDLPRLKVITEKKEILTQKEIKQLFQSLDFTLSPVVKRDKAILAVLYGAGLRKSELHKLNVDDISLTNQTLIVREGKGKKSRIVPLTNDIANIIKEYVQGVRDVYIDMAGKAEDALFIDVNGKRLLADNYYNIIERVLKESNIESIQTKRITLHTFRHSIATHLIQNKVDIEKVAQFLGHSSLDSTQIYLHLAHGEV